MASELVELTDWDQLVTMVTYGVVDRVRDGLRQRSRATLALAGGRTPCDIYRNLSYYPLKWDWVDVTLTDERLVGPLSVESNAALLRCKLLKRAAASARFTPLASSAKPSDDLDVIREASRAEEALRGLSRVFDVVLLGMGPGGQIASLLPESPVLDEALDLAGSRSCVPVRPAAHQGAARISLTLSALTRAREILLIIRGSEKRRTLEAARNDAERLVGALLKQTRAPVTVFWAP